MHQPIYRQIIQDAWHLAWRNKTLWLFGFFAGMLINGGAYDLGVKMFSRVTNMSYAWRMISQGIAEPELFIDISRFGWAPNISGISGIWTLVILVVSLAVVLFFIWLSITCQGALIAGVHNIIKKKRDPERKGFSQGLVKFWPLFGINILLQISILLLVVFTTFPLALLLSQSIMINALLYLLSFLIFLPLAIIIYFIALLAACYIVLRDKKMWPAIALAWDLFKRNWLICLELGLLLFVITFMVGLMIVLIFLILSVPVVLLFLASAALGSSTALLVIAILAFIIFAVITILGVSFVVSFQYTSWVLLFERLMTRGGISRIVRWIASLDKLHEKRKPKRKGVVRKRVAKRKK